MPTTATSVRVTSSVRGRRAKVAGPAYRGTRVASTGPIGLCDVMGQEFPIAAQLDMAKTSNL
jgi:hypothetical protein